MQCQWVWKCSCSRQKPTEQLCAAGDAGYTEYNGLAGKVKTGCMNTPQQQSLYCNVHGTRQIKGGGYQKVCEMILKSKTTRNATFYDVK